MYSLWGLSRHPKTTPNRVCVGEACSEEMAPPVTAGMNEGLLGVADGAQAVWFGVFWLNVLAPGAGGLGGAAQGSVQSPFHFGLFPGVWQ